MEKIKVNKQLSAGDTFTILGLEWKVLEVTEKGYKCLAERLEKGMTFGKSNDWKESSIRKYLNEDFYAKLVAVVGEGNIIPFERNLLSLDGQTEYGSCVDKVSLLNVDEYRKYRKHIPNAGYWWWTLTPDSTKCNGDDWCVRVVSPSGDFDNFICGDYGGVRPFCIFSSAIFESEEG
ncbi:MAG: hypothetical protein E7293_03255 [Lachnospiraceae bacterium]|nr:hypothetical protein [Lachnospiraceae bacterium]